MMRFRSTVVPAIALAVGLAACGSDDTSDTPAPTENDAITGDGDSDVAEVDVAEADVAEADVNGVADPDGSDMGSDAIEAAGEALDRIVDQYSDDGSVTITVDGITYTGEAEACMMFPEMVTVDGPVTAADGTVGWVQINYEPDSMTGDLDVELGIGVTARLDRVEEDQPRWRTRIVFDGEEPTAEYHDTTITGRGFVGDEHAVVVPFGEYAPFEFTANCG